MLHFLRRYLTERFDVPLYIHCKFRKKLKKLSLAHLILPCSSHLPSPCSSRSSLLATIHEWIHKIIMVSSRDNSQSWSRHPSPPTSRHLSLTISDKMFVTRLSFCIQTADTLVQEPLEQESGREPQWLEDQMLFVADRQCSVVELGSSRAAACSRSSSREKRAE
jgi:hypothetical protein